MAVNGNKSKHTRGQNERYLIRTRPKTNVHIFGKFCLRQSDERTNRYKTRKCGINTYLSYRVLYLFISTRRQSTIIPQAQQS